ncbi:hypothetical protein F4W66_24760 (plasmid) [Escherichia coli]|nr:hypothetical protein F4W66_24760 [Escherichia coli]
MFSRVRALYQLITSTSSASKNPRIRAYKRRPANNNNGADSYLQAHLASVGIEHRPTPPATADKASITATSTRRKTPRRSVSADKRTGPPHRHVRRAI